MKTVSFKVAKAIKEVGYPQGLTPYQYVTKDYDTFKEGEIIDSFYENWAGDNVIDAPLYLEVWLWLWREKDIQIDVVSTFEKTCFVAVWKTGKRVFSQCKYIDHEEAIKSAIEYLVDNDLIK